jgi:phage head maturation protease
MEYRTVTAPEVRVADEHKRQVEVIPITYNRLDTYRTVWEPGVFADSVERRPPTYAWAHDWRDPIGHLIDWQDGPEHPRCLFQLDDFDAVPRARQAFAQLKSGTMRDHSVGFERLEDAPEADSEKRWGVPDAVRILRADLDEVSPVLRGSVPGTATIGVRSPAATIARTEFLGLVRSLRDGDMTLEEALSCLRDVDERERRLGMHVHAKQDGSGTVSHSHVNGMTTHAHSGLMPRQGHRDAQERAQWGAAARKEAVQKGWAMADGSFPIKDASDVEDAVHLWQSGHGNSSAAKAHIIKRAKAIGATAKLPDDWVSRSAPIPIEDVERALALAEELL